MQVKSSGRSSLSWSAAWQRMTRTGWWRTRCWTSCGTWRTAMTCPWTSWTWPSAPTSKYSITAAPRWAGAARRPLPPFSLPSQLGWLSYRIVSGYSSVIFEAIFKDWLSSYKFASSVSLSQFGVSSAKHFGLLGRMAVHSTQAVWCGLLPVWCWANSNQIMR